MGHTLFTGYLDILDKNTHSFYVKEHLTAYTPTHTHTHTRQRSTVTGSGGGEEDDKD